MDSNDDTFTFQIGDSDTRRTYQTTKRVGSKIMDFLDFQDFFSTFVSYEDKSNDQKDYKKFKVIVYYHVTIIDDLGQEKKVIENPLFYIPVDLYHFTMNMLNIGATSSAVMPPFMLFNS